MSDFREGLIEDLKSDEGYRPSVYRDTEGYWTLGYGFLVDEKRGGRIPKPIAEQWLLYAVNERWNELVGRIPWVMEQPEGVRRALGNMAYQLGVNGVLNFKNMLAALLDGDRELAAEEALDSKWAIQTPNRAYRVAGLIRGTT